MQIRKTAVAGTMESSDVMVTVEKPEVPGIHIRIESSVLATFGDQIRETVKEVLSELEVRDVAVYVSDRGAIDCVIRARVAAAVCRAAEERYNWKGEDR